MQIENCGYEGLKAILRSRRTGSKLLQIRNWEYLPVFPANGAGDQMDFRHNQGRILILQTFGDLS